MHKSFKNFALAGAAMTLAMAPAMAAAQDKANPETGAPTSTPPTASSQPDTMPPVTNPTQADTTTPPAYPNPAAPAPADTTTTDGTATNPGTATPVMTLEQQQAAIKTWPRETQAYYESLTEERQKMFWALSDTDKVRLSNLPDEQKELAWGQIEAQIKSAQG